MRKYLAEFIGTFTLVFVGTAVVTLQGGPFSEAYGNNGWLGISMAFGFTLMTLVWTIGPVSGCHLNPAVTIPMGLSGRLPKSDIVPYIVAQCLGAVAASAVLLMLLNGIPGYSLKEHGLGANGNPREMETYALFGWELIMTALFLLTIFTVTRKGAPAGFEGYAIGGFLFIAHLVGAPLGDSSLNPARSLGPALMQGGASLQIVWLFIVSPILGGIVGWQLFNFLHDE